MDPALGLMLSCHWLGIFNTSEQGAPHVHLVLGPISYVAGPAPPHTRRLRDSKDESESHSGLAEIQAQASPVAKLGPLASSVSSNRQGLTSACK